MRRAIPITASVFLVLLLSFPGYVNAVSLVPGDVLSKGKIGPGLVLGAPVNLNADTLSYDEDTGVALAEGNVEVGFGNRTIRADRIRYDSRSGEADLTGRVHYKEGGDEFSFDRIVLNIDTGLGVLYNGTIRLSSNNYLISSEKFEKTGDRSFRVQKGILTTCPCDPEPDWKFEVRRSRVTIDGYAIGKDVTFKVRGVPILWLPWAAFPVKLTRQSGLLMPGFSSSGTKGFTIQLPYYWAISRWSDATITLEDMSRRGFRPEVEYRYVLNPASEGEARATAFHDKLTGNDRYRIYGKNTYRNGETLISNAKWDFASDDRYYLELVDDDILRTGRHIPSRGFAGREGRDSSLALSAVWVNDVQGTPDDNTVQRLPELSATFLLGEIGKTGIEASGDVNATYFYRRVEDRNLRGKVYSEISRTVPLYTSVTATPYVSLVALGSVPVRDGNGAQKSGSVIPGGGVRMEANFRRDFDRGGGRRLVHLLQPELSFRWVPSVDQKDIPLTDQWARIGSQKQFTFSLSQRLLRVADTGSPYDLASLSLEWAMDVRGKRSAGESPYLDPLSPYVRALRDQIDLATGRIAREREAASDVLASLQVNPAERWIFSGEALYGVDNRNFTTAAVGMEWKKNKENRALLEYRSSRDLSEDVHGLVAFRPFQLIGFENDVKYSIRNRELTEGLASFNIYPRSDCWSIGLMAGRRANPDESTFKVFFSLKGIGTIGN
ncbi:MAG: LPS assembly protein LptD [Deltaproteobacteria bacterium]|nr:LPS assembly protein LptD [Deltaproteobacteria bacterium]